MQFRTTSLVQIAFLLTVGTTLSSPRAFGASGFVYVATNQPTGNAVVQYSRASNGSLTKIAEVSTGGKGGTGNGVGNLDPLGSQDSLVLNDVGSLLLVVNAGSNELSALQAGGAGLKLLSKVSSGGPSRTAWRSMAIWSMC
jgi:hypothetical protein